MVHVLAPHRFPQSRRLVIEPRNTFVQGLGLWSQVKRRARQLVLFDRLSAWRHHWLLGGSITVASIAGLSASFTGPALVLMVFLHAGDGDRLLVDNGLRTHGAAAPLMVLTCGMFSYAAEVEVVRSLSGTCLTIACIPSFGLGAVPFAFAFDFSGATLPVLVLQTFAFCILLDFLHSADL